ncbi:MAG: ribosome assembly RNA-binding protein YhbY [Gammaproteobacteria bacterium]|nr:ribosome assembly RNA-binding protein YhbY [Gammaproteobacteria bacterium]
MSITSKQKQHLKALAHALKPVVIIGANGLSEAVSVEIENALAHHELLKVKINIGDKDDRMEVANTIATNLNAELVQNIGRISIFYRPSQNHKIQLPY